MRITIIGAGSIGLLLAGKLSEAQAADIELIARTEEQAERLRMHGVTVQEAVTGGSKNTGVRISPMGLAPFGAEQPDWVFLTVKQQAIDPALLRLIQASAPPRYGLLCWQNGIGHLELLAKANVMPVNKLYAAVTTEGARRLDLTVVAHTGKGTTAIGRIDEASESVSDAAAAEKMLIDALNSAGFAATVSKHIVADVWNKLLINAAINPLTAILNVPNGGLLRAESSRKLMQSLAAEAIQVALAEGVSPPDDMQDRIEDVCRKTALNRSSMLQDIDNGGITENEWISGSIVRLASRHSLSVPVTETVYQLVQALEKRG